jgi:glycosyltransferase involved in cell wall biosynthesis
MRIAHVAVEIVPSAAGAYVGGLVKSLATTARAQAAAGHDVEIVTTDIHGRLNGHADGPGLRTIPVQTFGEYGSLPFAGSFVARATRELRERHAARPYDVIHVHSAYASLAGAVYLMRGLGAPTAFTLYSPNFGLVPGHSCNGHAGLSGQRMAAGFLGAADRTIVPSESLRGRLGRLGVNPADVSLVPPALDGTFLEDLPSRAEARPALGLPADRPILLYLGNFSTWKGVHDLLDALADVRRTHPEVLLVTAWGEPYEWRGNDREGIQRLIRDLDLADAIRQVGIVEDVRVLLRAADGLVSPFHCTCKVLDYPLSILEAMACGTPVISTRVGGIPELIGDRERGVLVPPRDPSALGAAIRGLLDGPEAAASMSVRGAEWVSGRFRPDLVNEALESLYRELRERTRPGDAHPSPR